MSKNFFLRGPKIKKSNPNSKNFFQYKVKERSLELKKIISFKDKQNKSIYSLDIFKNCKKC